MPTSLRPPPIRNSVAYYQSISKPRPLSLKDWLVGVVLGLGIAATVLFGIALVLGAVWLVLTLMRAIMELAR